MTKLILTSLGRLYDQHRYYFSFVLTLILTSFVIFYRISNPYGIEDDALDILDFVDVSIKRPKVKQNKEVDPNADFDPTSQVDNIEKEAVDISFFSGITPPRLIGRLIKEYPAIAKKNEIEGVVFLEMIISREGKVIKVDVIGVKLNKILPLQVKSQVSKLFAQATQRILYKARYTRPFIQNKNVPIKMETSLRFSLED